MRLLGSVQVQFPSPAQPPAAQPPAQLARVDVTLGSLLVSLKGTCPLSIPGPWRIDCVLIGDRSPKCFKVVSLKAGQVRQFTCAELRTKVGKEPMTFRDISLLVAERL